MQKPPWVLIDGMLASLDEDVLAVVIDVFARELAQTGVIHIGGAGDAHGIFSKVLHLVKTAAPDSGSPP